MLAARCVLLGFSETPGPGLPRKMERSRKAGACGKQVCGACPLVARTPGHEAQGRGVWGPSMSLGAPVKGRRLRPALLTATPRRQLAGPEFLNPASAVPQTTWTPFLGGRLNTAQDPASVPLAYAHGVTCVSRWPCPLVMDVTSPSLSPAPAEEPGHRSRVHSALSCQSERRSRRYSR